MTTSTRRARRAAAATGVVLVAAALPAAGAPHPAAPWVWGSRTSVVSVGSGAAAADGPSYDNPALSRHGRYVAYASDATNLVEGDTNAATDIFVRDRRTGTTLRVSVGASGRQADESSFWPSMSADGRYVAFTSSASNLVAGDTNGEPDVFVRDLRRGTTRRVSLSSAERQGDAISLDGVISADGRHVVFVAEATNLVRDDTNRVSDVFVRHLRSGTTERVSVGRRGEGDSRSMGRAVSARGRYVAFVSLASNLVRADTNDDFDVFLRDTRTRKTVRVSVGPGGRQADLGDPMGTGFPQAISDDGRYVLFDHDATNLVDGDTNDRYDVFLRDVRTATTRRLSVGPDGSQLPQDSFAKAMTGDARKVLVATYNEIVPGDTNFASDVFVLHRRSGTMRLVSTTAEGRPGNDDTMPSTISADGHHVAFLSHAGDLVPTDGNPDSDIFVRDRRPGATRR